MAKVKKGGDALVSPPESTFIAADSGEVGLRSTEAAAGSEPALLSDGSRQETGSDTAPALFDGTWKLHQLSENNRRVLIQAVRLSRQPALRPEADQEQEIAGEANAEADSEMSEEDLYALTAVLAYHQGKLKRKQIGDLELSPEKAREVMTIAALLEIANAIDLDRDGRVLQKIEGTPERVWIVVDGPQAAADAAAWKQAARLWERIGYPAVEVLESAEADKRFPAFPESSEQIGLLADDDLAEAGRKVLRYQFARMLSLEEGTLLGEDIEYLHHMRVATRRLRAAFDVFEEAFKPGALKPYRDGMRSIGRALGTVRDLDVIMEKGRKYCESLPPERCGGLDPLMEMWAAQRDSARGELLEYMNSKEYAAFKRKFNIFLSSSGAGARRMPAGQPRAHTVRELAPALIYRQLGQVRAYGPFLPTAPIELLHMLRIEFKKLRYTVEYFQEALNEQRSRTVIETLRRMQDHLGDLNDADVATQLLRKLIDEWEANQLELPIQERKDLGEVVSYLAYRHAERHRLMTTFQAEWNKTFDRPALRKTLAQMIGAL